MEGRSVDNDDSLIVSDIPCDSYTITACLLYHDAKAARICRAVKQDVKLLDRCHHSMNETLEMTNVDVSSTSFWTRLPAGHRENARQSCSRSVVIGG